MVAAPCARRGRGRTPPRRRALLPEIPFAGRIRLRSRLGRCLYARRRALLPEAPGLGPVHAGDRSAPARRRRARAAGARRHLVAGLAGPAGPGRAPPRSTRPFSRRATPGPSRHEGFLLRTDQQFHWFNEGYGTFDDFLAALSSRKRKTIRRERRDALADGITVEWVTGRRPHRSALGRLLRFLHGHGLAQMGPALSQPALLLAPRRAHGRPGPARHGEAQRAATSRAPSISSATLGSTGGTGAASRIIRSCISRLCYYQAIDFAISRGLARVEAGAQGEHKLARGYRPVITTSAHDIADPALRRAIDAYLRARARLRERGRRRARRRRRRSDARTD